MTLTMSVMMPVRDSMPLQPKSFPARKCRSTWEEIAVESGWARRTAEALQRQLEATLSFSHAAGLVTHLWVDLWGWSVQATRW